MDTQTTYNYTVVRQFALMAVVWGIVGMAIGVWIASELVFPALNLGTPWLTFGRLRPLHTNIVIFAFAGSALFATSYYVVQRTCHTRLFGSQLAAFTFWGWQAIMALAVLTLPLGMTSGKEYAEFEWPIDILFTLVWVAYLVVFFGTLIQRKTPYIYVANWFYAAYILAVAMLHLVNSAALPVSLWPMKSYSVYPGAVDAMVTWWYGHNLVGFFLTAAFFGTLYYFLPKQADRPMYSYRLAVVQFWAFISLAMWSGPQHLLYSALPDWAQSLGMVFSVLLLVPFWGGLANGVMTLDGDWNRLRTDPVLRFIVVALFFYGLSSLEGPFMATKTVNAFTHYTDWTVGHAHSGGLGWIGFLSIGTLYALLPSLFDREQMYSTRLITVHFWFATLGVVIYLIAMSGAGMLQSTMWWAENNDGTLAYRFIDSVQAIHYFYFLRMVGGLLYLIGMLLMAYNVWKIIPAQAATYIPHYADGDLLHSEDDLSVVTEEGHAHHAEHFEPPHHAALAEHSSHSPHSVVPAHSTEPSHANAPHHPAH
ncbi:Cbb3-type cytochrome c oxidase subunit CcoN1 [Gammaproteobacteria bacterium]